MSQAETPKAQPDADAVARLSQALNLENCEDRFMSSDLSLLETGNFSDVELVCGDRSWSLHRSVICKRCKWFEKALTGDFEEAASRKITITEFSPELTNVVVRYLYSGAMDTTSVNECEGDSIISKYVRLWSAADFFGLEPLQKDIIATFEDYLEPNIKIMNQTKPAGDIKAIVEEFFSAVAIAYDVKNLY
ncbi:hypothetical protein J7T55_010837 [Diaporthe amygdali]|uniref:uncharacterized protein n=1 Tax=Phomopsis amygdali TaxID=1214568 RepID=UPI0022FF0635|nr:uncharacterized protein J7T55_010837 [Diaporthe amygdali]KAJ0114447.1 hypothetical protein J7T55_010837 [Diaporthe amygdali]